MRVSLLIRVLAPLLVFTGGCSYTQYYAYNPDELVKINIVDRDGLSETITNAERLKQYESVDFLCNQPYQKILRIYGRDEHGNSQAYITSYHPNGQLRQYLEVVNNRAFGAYREWYENGILKVDAYVIGGLADISIAAEKSWLFDGCARAWDEDGNFSALIDYSKGELEGITTYYHPNGNVWKRIPYCQNEINGTFQTYTEDGNLLQTIDYYMGKKQGTAFKYWNPELISSQETYSHDLLMWGNYYDLQGSLVSQVEQGEGYRALFGKESLYELQEYHEGLLKGEVQVFDSDGDLVRVYHVQNGFKHGEEVEYYPRKGLDPLYKPLLSITWHDGLIQGIVKTWYLNGVQESQREMSANKKNGIATAWYQNGSIMLIEEYNQNVLVKGEYFAKGDKIPATEVREGKGIATLYDADGNFVQKVNYLNGFPSD